MAVSLSDHRVPILMKASWSRRENSTFRDQVEVPSCVSYKPYLSNVLYDEASSKDGSKKTLKLVVQDPPLMSQLEKSERQLPAGSYTMRSDALGLFSRLLVNTAPLILKDKFAKPIRLASVYALNKKSCWFL